VTVSETGACGVCLDESDGAGAGAGAGAGVDVSLSRISVLFFSIVLVPMPET